MTQSKIIAGNIRLFKIDDHKQTVDDINLPGAYEKDEFGNVHFTEYRNYHKDLNALEQVSQVIVNKYSHLILGYNISYYSLPDEADVAVHFKWWHGDVINEYVTIEAATLALAWFKALLKLLDILEEK